MKVMFQREVFFKVIYQIDGEGEKERYQVKDRDSRDFVIVDLVTISILFELSLMNRIIPRYRNTVIPYM